MKIYALWAKCLQFAYSYNHFTYPKIFIFNIELLFMVDPLSFKAVQFIQPVNYFSIIAVITVLLMCLLLSQNCVTVNILVTESLMFI